MPQYSRSPVQNRGLACETNLKYGVLLCPSTAIINGDKETVTPDTTDKLNKDPESASERKDERLVGNDPSDRDTGRISEEGTKSVESEEWSQEKIDEMYDNLRHQQVRKATEEEDRQFSGEEVNTQQVGSQDGVGQMKSESQDTEVQDSLKEGDQRPGNQDTRGHESRQQYAQDGDQVTDYQGNLDTEKQNTYQSNLQDSREGHDEGDQNLQDTPAEQDSQQQRFEDKDKIMEAQRESTGDDSSVKCIPKKPGDCDSPPPFPPEEDEPEYGTSFLRAEPHTKKLVKIVCMFCCLAGKYVEGVDLTYSIDPNEKSR